VFNTYQTFKAHYLAELKALLGYGINTPEALTSCVLLGNMYDSHPNWADRAEEETTR
tara:strand:+ start:108 stop:278 length:171 start_codon:yes stop_codon:yes gene_type:complete